MPGRRQTRGPHKRDQAGLACQGEGGHRQDNQQDGAKDGELLAAPCGWPWPSSAPVLTDYVFHAPTLRNPTCLHPRIAYSFY